jgi:hypothetical protein
MFFSLQTGGVVGFVDQHHHVGDDYNKKALLEGLFFHLRTGGAVGFVDQRYHVGR